MKSYKQFIRESIKESVPHELELKKIGDLEFEAKKGIYTFYSGDSGYVITFGNNFIEYYISSNVRMCALNAKIDGIEFEDFGKEYSNIFPAQLLKDIHKYLDSSEDITNANKNYDKMLSIVNDLVKDIKNKMKMYKPEDEDELKEYIQNYIDEHGYNCDLNHIHLTNVRDLSNLFEGSNFNGNISKWNVSKVTNMRFMFNDSSFNQNISNWDVSYVKDNFKMFYDCPIKEEFKPKFNDEN